MYNKLNGCYSPDFLLPAYYIQTTLLFPPETVLTVKWIPLTADAQQGNNNRATDNNLYNSFSGIFIGEEEETEVDEKMNETH